MTVEEYLDQWASQDPDVCRVSKPEWDFIRAMRLARTAGVGYGWMKQIIDVEWASRDITHRPDVPA